MSIIQWESLICDCLVNGTIFKVDTDYLNTGMKL